MSENLELKEEVASHVYQIIMELEPNERVLIPLSVRKFFEINSIQGKYNLNFSKPIKEQISKDTENILVYIYSYLKKGRNND